MGGRVYSFPLSLRLLDCMLSTAGSFGPLSAERKGISWSGPVESHQVVKVWRMWLWEKSAWTGLAQPEEGKAGVTTGKKVSWWGHAGSGAGHTVRLCRLSPWKFLGPDWRKPWAAWSDHSSGPAWGRDLNWRPPELPSNPSDSPRGSGSSTTGGTWLHPFWSET